MNYQQPYASMQTIVTKKKMEEIVSYLECICMEVCGKIVHSNHYG